MVGWDDGVPTPAELDGIGRAAQRRVHGSLAVALHGHMVLLYPPGACASDVMGWMEQVVSVARATVPALGARAVAADQEVAVHELREQVARLARLCARRGSGPPVTRARQHALEDLLSESVAPAEARRFVDDLLGPLIAWDHEHHSDLIRVLEAALDHPRHDVAAQRCFMHRNTFRHRLGKARDLLGDDLTDPKTRSPSTWPSSFAGRRPSPSGSRRQDVGTRWITADTVERRSRADSSCTAGGGRVVHRGDLTSTIISGPGRGSASGTSSASAQLGVAGPRAGGLADQVVAFGDVGGPPGPPRRTPWRRRAGRRRARAGGRGRHATGGGRRAPRAADRSRAAPQQDPGPWPIATARPAPEGSTGAPVVA